MNIYARIVFYGYFFSMLSLFAAFFTMNMPPYNLYLLSASVMSGIIGSCAMILYFTNRLDKSIRDLESSLLEMDRRIVWLSESVDRRINDNQVNHVHTIENMRKEFNDDIRELSHSIEKNKDKVGV